MLCSLRVPLDDISVTFSLRSFMAQKSAILQRLCRNFAIFVLELYAYRSNFLALFLILFPVHNEIICSDLLCYEARSAL